MIVFKLNYDKNYGRKFAINPTSQEELKKQTRQLKSTYHPEKSRTEAALVSDALEFILKNAGAGLF